METKKETEMKEKILSILSRLYKEKDITKCFKIIDELVLFNKGGMEQKMLFRKVFISITGKVEGRDKLLKLVTPKEWERLEKTTESEYDKWRKKNGK